MSACRIFLLGVLFLLCVAARPAVAESADSAYVEELVAAARRARLAHARTWLKLGHWRPRTLGGYLSEADGKPFFLAADGKSNPEAELDATLRGFWSNDAYAEPLQHPICRFPARLAWLSDQLHIDLRRLPRRSCAGLGAYWDKLRPKSIRVIFSSYYLNNPASAFGHTFLRIDRNDPYPSSTRRDLLDYGVDFSANVDTGNALVYAIKGLFGLFPGTYKLRPYFYKVREYGDYESRDLWEYELALDEREVALVAAHLWELGSTYFDYYYITENCAYQILAAVDVARPELDLVSRLSTPVLPVDTIKVLTQVPGLVRRVRYRPSIRSQFRQRAVGLSARELDRVEALGVDPEAPLDDLSPGEKVDVLDAALDYIDFRYAKELIDPKRSSPGSRLKQRLEERRSEILVASRALPQPDLAGSAPELSHDSRRLLLGSGASRERGGYATASFRLALHDLADPVPGFPEFSEIQFMAAEGRFYYRDKLPELEDLSLVRVVSLTPFNRFEQRFSWKVDVGATRLRDDGCGDCIAARLEFAAGGTVAVGSDAVGLYGLFDMQVLLGPDLRGIADRWARAGIGPTGGLRLRWTDRFITLVDATYLCLPFQSTRSMWSVGSTTRLELAPGIALGLSGRKQELGAEAQLVGGFYL